MLQKTARITLSSPEETAALARRLGAHLAAGDVVLLEGSIGAGKTHFARCLIQSRLSVAEDVPSPTFTLVQTYDAEGTEIWHADLYRLASPDDVVELGLIDAFETAICLVEWPDRLGSLIPRDALTLAFRQGAEDDTRILTLTWTAPKWDARLSGDLND
jgi:tRNA threonylcarbamoyladenosine biosynthesis protein TsaE